MSNRVTQDAVAVLVAPTVTNARISQVAVSILVPNGTAVAKEWAGFNGFDGLWGQTN